MRSITAILFFSALTACAADDVEEPAPVAEVQAAALPDCSTASCTRVTYTPVNGGIEAGEGLRHLGCFVTVEGCFEAVCWTTPADRAWCGATPLKPARPTH